MIPQSDLVRLRHMRDAAREASRLVIGRRRSELEQSGDALAYGLIHLVTVVGEAANAVSEVTRRQLPQLEWRQMVDMRNRLVHAYFDINYDILWTTVQEELPSLLAHLEPFLAEESHDP